MKPSFLTKSTSISAPAGHTHYHLTPSAREADITIALTHPGSSVYVTGALQGHTGEQQVALTINHQAAATTAQILVKTLASGNAKHSFKGLLSIAPNTPNCTSYLTHQSLLFDQAVSKSWPALEIANNEVKCSHAATSKTITNDDLFYLRSRGLSEQEARTLLVEAFLSDVTF